MLFNQVDSLMFFVLLKFEVIPMGQWILRGLTRLLKPKARNNTLTKRDGIIFIKISFNSHIKGPRAHGKAQNYLTVNLIRRLRFDLVSQEDIPPFLFRWPRIKDLWFRKLLNL